MDEGKLVRDRIPEIIQAGGGAPQVRVLDQAAYRVALARKLQEEVDEFLRSGQAEELADILEVIYALAQVQGMAPSQLEALRLRKRGERGGFQRRLFLVSASSSA